MSEVLPGLWSGQSISLLRFRLLALIEMGGSDSQSLIGQGNVSGHSVSRPTMLRLLKQHGAE